MANDFLNNSVLISQGAESRVFKVESFLGRPCAIKERFEKKYRHPTLDKKLTQKRTVGEVRAIVKAKKNGIDTPIIYFVDTINSRIFMEFVDGITVKQTLYNNGESHALAKEIAHTISKLHNFDLIHGDLTTSNLMIRKNSQNITIIDFGLAFVSNLIEDKAVDLYVLERAFLGTHPNSEDMFQTILSEYELNTNKGNEIINRLKQVQLRGRKKLAFG